MRGASRESLNAARESLAALTDVPTTDVTALSDDLAAIAALLDGEVSLRRLLTDPARTGEQRAALVADLLAGKVGEHAVELVSGVVRSRWSQPRDLADALDELSVEAELALAERAGTLDSVEDDLFRFGRILAAEPELAQGLSQRIPAAPAYRPGGLAARRQGQPVRAAADPARGGQPAARLGAGRRRAAQQRSPRPTGSGSPRWSRRWSR